MKAMKGLHLLLVLTVLFGIAAIFVPVTLAQNIHVLMVIDNGHPKTGTQHGKDKAAIEGLMNTKVSDMIEKVGGKVNIDELLSNDRQVTRDKIFNWLKNVNPDPKDVVFVYFSGHGGADKTGSHARYITIQGNEKLYRKEVAKVVEALNCRLKILITDACSAGPLRTEEIPIPSSDEDILRNLFLQHEGFLNLTSTSVGHVAFGDKTTGSYFTASLMEGIIPGDLADVDRAPQDGFVSWEEVLTLTKEHLDDLYQANKPYFSTKVKQRMKRIGQTTQIPEALSPFPKPIP